MESEKPVITSFDVFLTKILKHLTLKDFKRQKAAAGARKDKPKSSQHSCFDRETGINQLRSRVGGDPPSFSLSCFSSCVLSISFSLHLLSSSHVSPRFACDGGWSRRRKSFISFHEILLVSIFSRCPAILEFIADWLLPSGILSGMSGTFSNHYRERKRVKA